MADWERRLAEEADQTRAELKRRIMQGDDDRGMGFFNIPHAFFGQFMILVIALIIVMAIGLAIFLFSRVSPGELRDDFIQQRELIWNEQAREGFDQLQ